MDHNSKIFHLGLCMAGSVSAGAYTAGVIDYLQEALENWEVARGQNDIPDHQVVIDLLGGTSGGGIAAALALFGLRDKVQHAKLDDDGETYHVDKDKNIYWRTWVELSEGDVLKELLKSGDLEEGYIPSALNSGFIDEVAGALEKYFIEMRDSESKIPAFFNERAELFLSLFNVTGLKYMISSKSGSVIEQYVAEHRDIAHFRWSDAYKGDGRINISLQSSANFRILIDSAKATGAYPIGLKARKLKRPAKYIWDNPFYRKNGKFNKDTINLGKNKQGNNITDGEDIYESINSDGGVANNEPVELFRDIMLKMRMDQYKDVPANVNFDKLSDAEKMKMKEKLSNSSVILIDPFPSVDSEIKAPVKREAHLFSYAPKLINAMRSQLIFDAKQAFDAYDKDNYGLHLIAPSRKHAKKPEYALACGSLEGFGGFLSKEFRIHDFFLGRHNCQSFIRKYFLVNLNEPDADKSECVSAIINSYKNNEAAKSRFGFKGENKDFWVPIIPDISMQIPIKMSVSEADGEKIVTYEESGKLPLYKLGHLKKDFFNTYREDLKRRIRDIINFSYDGNPFVDTAIRVIAQIYDDKLADQAINYALEDMKERGLIK